MESKNFSMQIQKANIYHGSYGQIGNLHKRGKHPKHLIAIFFNLEKAYETTWKFFIIKDLHSLRLRGRLPNFKGLLSDRKFRVRFVTTFSNFHEQKERVHRGSILLVTLFNLKINHITKLLYPGIDDYLYVDNCITSRSKSMRTAKRQQQKCIQKISQWASINGFMHPKANLDACIFITRKKSTMILHSR